MVQLGIIKEDKTMSDNINNTNPPSEPLTREEEYLSAIAGVTSSDDIPEKPLTRVEQYLNKIVEDGGGSVYDKLEEGTNISIEETSDGKAKISATGEVSSEDTYAREQIADHIADKDNPHEVSAADVGLGNCDNTSDLNKPISTATQAALNLKADKTEIPSVPITAIQKNGTGITPVSGTVNITVPTSAADVSALPDTTKYAAALSLTINSLTYVMTGQLKDQNGDNLGTAQTIDLPLESVVVGGSYNSQTKKVVLTLQNGNTIEFSVADLVSGLQTELSASNKLNPAYINYDSTHRAVSDTEKSTWNGKQNAIDSSHKLSADLVDDTSTTNKFATAAELEQIETNKTNISYVADLVDSGAKNHLINKATTTTSAYGITYTVNADKSITVTGTSNNNYAFNVSGSRTYADALPIPKGEYIVKKGVVYTTTTPIYIQFGIMTDSSAAISWNNIGVNDYTFTVTNDTTRIVYELYIPSGVYSTQYNYTFYPMICDKAAFELSDKYVPYVPTNQELYAMIQAL
jgi:hypothetical protein